MYWGLEGEGLGSICSFHHLVYTKHKSNFFKNLIFDYSCLKCRYCKLIFFVGVKGLATFDKENTTEEVCVSHPWKRERGELN